MKLCGKDVKVFSNGANIAPTPDSTGVFVLRACKRRVEHSGACFVKMPLTDQLYQLGQCLGMLASAAVIGRAINPQDMAAKLAEATNDAALARALLRQAIVERWHEDHERHHDLEIVHACVVEYNGTVISEHIPAVLPGIEKRERIVVEPWVEVACDALRERRVEALYALLDEHAPRPVARTPTRSRRTRKL